MARDPNILDILPGLKAREDVKFPWAWYWIAWPA